MGGLHRAGPHQHGRGVASIALLVALTSVPCAGIARTAGKGCGSAGRSASGVAARSAEDWVSAANVGRMRGGSAGMNGVGAAGLGVDDISRVGINDAASVGARAADEAAMTKLAEHSFDVIDLAQLALGPDEVLHASRVVDVDFGETRLHDAAAGTIAEIYLSTLSVRGDPAEVELFTSTRELRGIQDTSHLDATGLTLRLHQAQVRTVVLIAPEFEDGGEDPAAAQFGLGADPQRRASLSDIAQGCVSEGRTCILLGCDPDQQLRCGLAAFDLALACEHPAGALADCLRARSDADPHGPSVSIAFRHNDELRVLRSTLARP